MLLPLAVDVGDAGREAVVAGFDPQHLAAEPDLVAAGRERHRQMGVLRARLGVDLAAEAGAEAAVEAAGAEVPERVGEGAGGDPRRLRERVEPELLAGAAEHVGEAIASASGGFG